jgi:hypothetical protein
MNYHNSTKKVKLGDIIEVNLMSPAPKLAQITNLISPNTQDAVEWSLPNGGVIIEGKGIGMIMCESLENDEDVKFVKRSKID